VQNGAHHPPSQHEHDDKCDDREEGHHHRRFDPIAHPGDGNLTRAISDPANAGGDDSK